MQLRHVRSPLYAVTTLILCPALTAVKMHASLEALSHWFYTWYIEHLFIMGAQHGGR
jgi:hypothetical protein